MFASKLEIRVSCCVLLASRVTRLPARLSARPLAMADDAEALRARVSSLEAALETEKAKARRTHTLQATSAREHHAACLFWLRCQLASHELLCFSSKDTTHFLLRHPFWPLSRRRLLLINSEQACQNLELRYTALAEEHSKASALGRLSWLE